MFRDWEVIGPVRPAAREQRGLALLEAAHHAVAIELDRVDPAVADGRLGNQGGQLGFDALGERRPARAGDLRRIGERLEAERFIYKG